MLMLISISGCKKDETVTFENGVTKLATNLYTVTIEDEYDVHIVDDYLKENYWDETYVDYYQNQYNQLIEEILNSSGGACSGARNGNLVGRTYDWFYDDYPSVIVKTTSNENRLASIACYSGVKNTTQIENEEVGVSYSLIVDDGINEAGVSFQTNVLQLGDEVTSGTNPNGQDTCAFIVGRIILDNARSVDEAIQILQSLNLYATYGKEMCDEHHWFINDKDKGVVVEMVDNQLVITETNIITNFYVNDKYFDGTIESLKENEPRAMGWRRYFILQEGLDDVKSIEDMFNHMSKVFYWHAYDADATDYWYDEGYGLYDYGYFDMLNESDDNPVCKTYKDYYCGLGHMNKFGDGTWFTAHTSVFDLENKTMSIAVDEQGYEKAFTFNFDFDKK